MGGNNRVLAALSKPFRTSVFVLGLAGGFVCGQLGHAREPVAGLAPFVASGMTSAGEAISYPAGAPAKVTASVVSLAPGEATGWHTHGVTAFGYILEGGLTVDYGDKGVRVYRAGDAVLEAIDVLHNGRNSGAAVMRILAVFMGAEGLATSVPAGHR